MAEQKKKETRPTKPNEGGADDGGAGPAMLAAVRPRGGDSVARAMERSLRSAGIAGRALRLPVDAGGATWERLPET